MTPDAGSPRQSRQRLDALVQQGQALDAEGLPFPTEQIRSAYDAAMAEGDPVQASTIVKRGEALLTRVRTDWTWVKELLRRADELRAIAESIGVDVAHLDHRVGNPRARLRNEPLSSGSLEKAAASASLSLAVLNDAMPKFIVQEAQQLGVSIRRARDRGEDVREVVTVFGRLLQAVQDQNLPTSAQRLVEARRAVGRIPRAPALPAISPREEEEILLEARNLARRLQRIRGKAQSAQSAARLMAQVRAAISEERRYGTPEEEIDALYNEVERLARERKRASEGPPLSFPPLGETAEPETESPEEPEPEADALSVPATEEAPEEERPDEEVEARRASRRSYYVPYLPPVPEAGVVGDPNDPANATRARQRGRPRA